MLSVIHPSSTQQHHIGAFRSSNSYHNSEAFGFHPASSSMSNTKYINSGSGHAAVAAAAGKWVPSSVQEGSGAHHPQWPTSSAAYLFRHHPQYTNSGSAAFAGGVSSSFKFYNYAAPSTSSTSTSSRSTSRSNRGNSTSSSSSSRSSESTSSSSRSSSNILPVAKDYSKPLFVDCSIEYELPNAPKIPKNSEPILMIHPAYNKQTSRSVKRASSSSLSKSSSASSSSSSSQRGVSNTNSKSKGGVKRTHSQLSSTDVIMSNQVALLQHQGLQFSSRHHQSCCSAPHYGQNPPPAKRCCPGLLLSQEQIKQQEFRQQQVQHHQQQYYWQQTMNNNSRCNGNNANNANANNNTYSHLPPHQQPNTTDYCCWLPTPTSSAALAYYKAQLRMRQQESFLKSISQGAATQSFCLDCVQGKCSQVAWNKENLGFMRSL